MEVYREWEKYSEMPLLFYEFFEKNPRELALSFIWNNILEVKCQGS